MRGTERLAAVVACVVCSTSLALAQAPATSSFTYQGELRDNGGLANGLYDLQFRLWDNVILGNPVSGIVTIPNVNVADGRFTVQLDFGAGAFNGDRLWLGVAVRPAGSGSYTDLNPRSELTAAPYAAYALNSFWTASGDAIQNTNSGFVGIGRSSSVSGAERFGIYAPGGDNTYGGMYIEMEANAWPFYGFASGTERAWIYFDGQTQQMLFYNDGARLAIDNAGNVGIGTTAPAATLDVSNGGSQPAILAESPWIGVYGKHAGSGSFPGVLGETDSTSVNANGVRGVVSSTGAGNLSAGVRGINNGTGGSGVGVYGSHEGSGWGLYGTSTSGVGVRGHVDSSSGWSGYFTGGRNYFQGNVGIGTTAPSAALHVIGTTRTSVVEITGGSDLSEGFNVASDDVRPGMVVVIDPREPGRLMPATEAYDHKVAGVISGAGGVQPGMIMSQDGTLAAGAHPVALTGRVYVLADAASDAIQPGDLLTTSDTPGHAMKATDRERSHGAILGKAMTGLAAGERGMVLVLVNLQ